MAKLIILPAAARYFKKLKDRSLKGKFQAVIDKILRDPWSGTPKTGDLAGVYGCDIIHHKTHYELAYTIIEHNGQTVVVVLAGTRENFYKQLKRYMK